MDGKPVLALAAAPFAVPGLFKRIIVTAPRGGAESVRSMLAPHVPLASLTVIEGGETRQDSVMKALLELEADPPWGVLVHDGARPWITADIVRRVMESAAQHRACVPIVEVPEAVKLAGSRDFVTGHLKRDELFFAQTPQGFEFEGLLSAYRQAARLGVSGVDDSELYGMFVGAVATVPGDVRNRKITYERDLPGGA